MQQHYCFTNQEKTILNWQNWEYNCVSLFSCISLIKITADLCGRTLFMCDAPSGWGTLLIPHNELGDGDCQHDFIIPAEAVWWAVQAATVANTKSTKGGCAQQERIIYFLSLHASVIRGGRTMTTIGHLSVHLLILSRKCKSWPVLQLYPNYIHVQYLFEWMNTVQS